MATFDFANPEREMRLRSLHPGVALEDVTAEVGWQLRLAEPITETPPPSKEELRLLREELDPNGLYRREVAAG
jgi:hypothetical protein